MKYLKRILLVLLVAFITYFGGGQKYINEGLVWLVDKIEGLIPSETENRQSEDEKKQIKGTIIRVSDGDTVVLKDKDGKKHKIRLDGIDAPEIGQDYGEESKNFVVKLALNKNAVVEVIGKDQYNRTLGILYIGDTNVNEELLISGLAWQYRFNKNSDYAQLVQRAKSKHLNIWSNPASLDPYVWRKQNNK